MTREQIAAVENATHRLFLETFYLTVDPMNTFDVIDADANGTGYYDGLVRRNLRKPIGTILRAVTPGANNRRMLVVVTPVGNLVIFERYTDGATGVLVTNMPKALGLILDSGRVQLDNLERMVGGGGHQVNIGEALLVITEVAGELDFQADLLAVKL